MAVKILSQSGLSLADQYNVEGSQAPVGPLLSQEGVHLMHEMGQTIMSERLAATFVHTTSDVPQSTNFTAEIGTPLPNVPMLRVLGIIVNQESSANTQIDHLTILARDDAVFGFHSDMPMWVFDQTNIDDIRFSPGDGTINGNVLRPRLEYTRLPFFLVGATQREQVTEIFMQGRTQAFGAGNLEITASVMFAFPRFEGLSSRGIPIPSW